MRSKVSQTLFMLAIVVLLLPALTAQTCTLPTCFSEKLYRFDVVAQTGQNVGPGTLSGVGIGPSINEKGEVAFMGHLVSGTTPLGDGIFLWKPTAPTSPIYVSNPFLGTNRAFFDAVQLNKQEQIAALDRFAGSPPAFLLRVWEGNNPGNFTLIARSGFTGDPFGLVYSSPGLSGKGGVVFSAADLKFNNLLATPNATKTPPFNELNMSTPVRPQIADNGMVVVREGNTDTSPIVLFNNSLDSTKQIVIASSSEFDVLGQSPGISRDGVAIAFAGNMNATGAAHWGTNAGPGVFVAILKGGKVYQIIRVAGFSTSAGSGTRFISVDPVTGQREEGLPWCDSNATCVTGGELEDLPPALTPTPVYFQTFTAAGFSGSTEWESRIAVTHLLAGNVGLDGDGIVVSFIATPNVSDSKGLGLFSGLSGLWSTRVDLFDPAPGFFAHVYRPRPVLQVGDIYPVDGTTITAISVYDQLANQTFSDAGTARSQSLGDHRIALWLSTSASGQAILRGSYVQTLGGSSANTVSGCGATGTLGALVKKAGVNYVLSNDHVFGDPLSVTQNGASVGDMISSPGSADYTGGQAPGVATFSLAPTLSTGMDAAIAKLDPGKLNLTGQIDNIGVPAAPRIAPNKFAVSKQGRTTGLTCGAITAFGMKVNRTVGYETCSKTTFQQAFSNLILIQTNDVPFSLPGDSGSLIVKQATAQPVGLLFAGDQPASPPYSTLAIPVGAVATSLGIAFAGGVQHAILGCHNAAAPSVELSSTETERVRAVKEKYEDELMNDPSVLGVGIGAAEDASEGAIIVLVERGKLATVPTSLEGIRVRLVYSGPIRALGGAR